LLFRFIQHLAKGKQSKSKQSLSLEILERSTVDNIAFGVLEFLISFRVPTTSILLHTDLAPKLYCLVNLRDIREMGSIGDTETNACHENVATP